MTIISSVYVPGGIAMSADSRLTGTRTFEGGIERYTLSDNEQKIILIRESSVGVSYTGNATIDGQTIGDFIRKFDINQVEKEDTIQMIAEKLKSLLNRNYPSTDILFIISGYDGDNQNVFTVDQNEVRQSNAKKSADPHYGASWYGDIEPISKMFKDTLFNFSLMPIKDAVDLSEFIVETSIKYGRFKDTIPTSGGEIDLLVITKDRTEFVRHKLFKS